MKLSSFINQLKQVNELRFTLPNGQEIPAYFHITEAGLTTKHFIDCGGAIRLEKTVSFQMWISENDKDHRLAPSKLSNIIDIASPLFGNEDLEIEVEYQTETISRYGVEFNGEHFVLTTKQTDCLAKGKCGIPEEKTRVALADLTKQEAACCSPASGCC